MSMGPLETGGPSSLSVAVHFYVGTGRHPERVLDLLCDLAEHGLVTCTHRACIRATLRGSQPTIESGSCAASPAGSTPSHPAATTPCLLLDARLPGHQSAKKAASLPRTGPAMRCSRRPRGCTLSSTCRVPLLTRSHFVAPSKHGSPDWVNIRKIARTVKAGLHDFP